MIPTLIAQVICGIVVDGRTLGDAMSVPRVHHQHQREVHVEESLGTEIIEGLAFLGDPVVCAKRLAIGAGIHRRNGTGEIAGVLDPRFGQYR